MFISAGNRNILPMRELTVRRQPHVADYHLHKGRSAQTPNNLGCNLLTMSHAFCGSRLYFYRIPNDQYYMECLYTAAVDSSTLGSLPASGETNPPLACCRLMKYVVARFLGNHFHLCSTVRFAARSYSGLPIPFPSIWPLALPISHSVSARFFESRPAL